MYSFLAYLDRRHIVVLMQYVLQRRLIACGYLNGDKRIVPFRDFRAVARKKSSSAESCDHISEIVRVLQYSGCFYKPGCPGRRRETKLRRAQ